MVMSLLILARVPLSPRTWEALSSLHLQDAFFCVDYSAWEVVLCCVGSRHGLGVGFQKAFFLLWHTPSVSATVCQRLCVSGCVSVSVGLSVGVCARVCTPVWVYSVNVHMHVATARLLHSSRSPVPAPPPLSPQLKRISAATVDAVASHPVADAPIKAAVAATSRARAAITELQAKAKSLHSKEWVTAELGAALDGLRTRASDVFADVSTRLQVRAPVCVCVLAVVVRAGAYVGGSRVMGGGGCGGVGGGGGGGKGEAISNVLDEVAGIPWPQ